MSEFEVYFTIWFDDVRKRKRKGKKGIRVAEQKFVSGGIMFPINRQTRIKTSRLPTVTKCDTRFRNNAKFGSFDVLHSQREFRVVSKKLSTVSLTVVSRVVSMFAEERRRDIVYFYSNSRTFRFINYVGR